MFGIPLRVNVGRRGPSDNSPTLDRIIPRKGYVRGNIIVISFFANRVKNNATVEQLFLVARFYKRLIQRNKNPKTPHRR